MARFWDAFQSNLVKSCEFFGTFNGFMAEKSLAAFKSSFFLHFQICCPQEQEVKSRGL
jgi:hypothetical protein